MKIRLVCPMRLLPFATLMILVGASLCVAQPKDSDKQKTKTPKVDPKVVPPKAATKNDIDDLNNKVNALKAQITGIEKTLQSAQKQNKKDVEDAVANAISQVMKSQLAPKGYNPHESRLDRYDKLYDLRVKFFTDYMDLMRDEALARQDYHRDQLNKIKTLYKELRARDIDPWDRLALEKFLEQKYFQRREQLESDVTRFLYQFNGAGGPNFQTPVPSNWLQPCPNPSGASPSPKAVFRRLGAAGPGGHGKGFKVPANFAHLRANLNQNKHKTVLAYHKNFKSNLEPNFDSRDIMARVPPIQDQGQCGSCWIFGTVAAYEFNYQFQNLSPNVDASEQYLLNCTSIDEPCNGAMPQDAARYLMSTGTSSRAEVPYTASPQQCTGTIRFKALNYAYVDATQDIPQVEDIKSAIRAYGAVVVGVCAGDNFENYTGAGNGLFTTGDAGDVNHAVALVGWKTVNTELYWVLRNSWGTSWGKDGYMWIKAGTAQVGYGALWVSATPSTNPTPDPTPVPDNNGALSDRINFWKQNYPQFAP